MPSVGGGVRSIFDFLLKTKSLASGVLEDGNFRPNFDVRDNSKSCKIGFRKLSLGAFAAIARAT